tara:strand:+ start:9072 stop:9455 length:384 start_codon:yes stop_codon:yes gene_type:complete
MLEGNMMKPCGDFRWDLEVGQIAEKWLGGILNSNTIEVKRDFVASRTGNVFVEFSCRDKPSGIATTMATHWAFVFDDETVVLLPTEKLKVIAREAYRKRGTFKGGDSNASLGVLIRVERLVNHAISC